MFIFRVLKEKKQIDKDITRNIQNELLHEVISLFAMIIRQHERVNIDVEITKKITYFFTTFFQ